MGSRHANHCTILAEKGMMSVHSICGVIRWGRILGEGYIMVRWDGGRREGQ